MYSFAQRYYAHYLQWSGVEHPGRNEILDSMNFDLHTVQTQLITNSAEVKFIKNMAHHYRQEDFEYLLDFKNILYIRNPRAIIRSYSRVIEKPTTDDVGIHKVKQIFDYLKKSNRVPLVLDSDDLVADPGKILTLLCEKLDIPFDDTMLKWEQGPKPYDGVWARYWYASVHNSSGFNIQKPGNYESIELRPELEQLAIECMPAYKALKQNAIKP
jgi:hypothetical protein